MMKKLNKLNKMLSLVFVLGMMMALVACGGEKKAKSPDEVKGKTYDTGKFTVLVPDGWMAFPAKNDGKKISVKDADVQAILASIKVK